MSEAVERTRAAISSEWATTAEIADSIPVGRGVSPDAHRRAVYKHLRKAVKHGVAECRVEGSVRGGTVAFWRLRQ
jgi:hypothetical protein